MRNRFIFTSVALLAKFKVAEIGITFKAQSEINSAFRSFIIILSRKQFNKAGYR
jgi:hypothetical protein